MRTYVIRCPATNIAVAQTAGTDQQYGSPKYLPISLLPWLMNNDMEQMSQVYKMVRILKCKITLHKFMSIGVCTCNDPGTNEKHSTCFPINRQGWIVASSGQFLENSDTTKAGPGPPYPDNLRLAALMSARYVRKIYPPENVTTRTISCRPYIITERFGAVTFNGAQTVTTFVKRPANRWLPVNWLLKSVGIWGPYIAPVNDAGQPLITQAEGRYDQTVMAELTFYCQFKGQV